MPHYGRSYTVLGTSFETIQFSGFQFANLLTMTKAPSSTNSSTQLQAYYYRLALLVWVLSDREGLTGPHFESRHIKT